MLRIEVQDADSNLILHCFGRIVRGEDLDSLRRAALARNPRNLIIDLQGVPSVDAGALGLLAELQERANASGHAFTLLNPSPSVARVLADTKLNRVMRVVKDPAWDAGFVLSEAAAEPAVCAAER